MALKFSDFLDEPKKTQAATKAGESKTGQNRRVEQILPKVSHA